jgi:hypothetical protein
MISRQDPLTFQLVESQSALPGVFHLAKEVWRTPLMFLNSQGSGEFWPGFVLLLDISILLADDRGGINSSLVFVLCFPSDCWSGGKAETNS